MKYVFLMIFVLLLAASALTSYYLPDTHSDTPVIYWVTDANPAREEQVRLFHRWMLKQGHVKRFDLKDANSARRFFVQNHVAKVLSGSDMGQQVQNFLNGQSNGLSFPMSIELPAARLELDMANREASKQVIQGVSGVAGDIMDQNSGADMIYFRNLGLNADVTEAGQAMGFGPEKTYPALLTDLTMPDPETGQRRQYQFPCNVSSPAYFVNKRTFRQHGCPVPSGPWTVEEFERQGKDFVEKANVNLPVRKVFFAGTVDTETLRRTYGASRFNETATASTIGTPESIAALKKIYQWMHIDRLIPTEGDRAGFSIESGYGGQDAQLFSHTDPKQGQIGMTFHGRYFLIEFRKADATRKARGEPPLEMGVVPPPHKIVPNTGIGTRAAMVYALGKHKDLATLFLAFLASKEYNQRLVDDADALPPDPTLLTTESYLRPKDYPNEWEVHEGFAKITQELSIGASYSPFVLPRVSDRVEASWREKYLNHLIDVETAARESDQEIEREIQRSLEEDRLRAHPRLNDLYKKLKERQIRIDQLKADIIAAESAGRKLTDDQKIPLDWLENPYHRVVYQKRGWTK